MKQAIKPGQYLDESTKVHDTRNSTKVRLTHLSLCSKGLDAGNSSLCSIAISCCDQDGTVIRDIDLSAGLLGDRTDHLAARSDHIADLVRMDHKGDDSRRKRRNVRSRLGNGLSHNVKNMDPSLA